MVETTLLKTDIPPLLFEFVLFRIYYTVLHRNISYTLDILASDLNLQST